MSDLIPEATLALVGELLDEPLASTISLKESQRYALAAGAVGGLLQRQRKAVRHGSGIVFIALGATAAFAKRT